jgi:hypothetical protein
MTDRGQPPHDDLTIDDDLQVQDDELLSSIWVGWGGPSGFDAHDRDAERQDEVDLVARFKDRLRQGARERGSRPRDDE